MVNRNTLIFIVGLVVMAVCIPLLGEQPAGQVEKAQAVLNKAAKDTAVYVGDKKCKPCHAKVYEAWKNTPHAGAFQAMVDSAGADTTCLQCHAVGYRLPGGFVDTVATPNLENVQCENCHGPGGKYMALPIMKDRAKALAAGMVLPNEEACKVCHDEKQSPEFKLEDAMRKGTHLAPLEPERPKE
jgi:hypothetical protein